MLNSQLKIRRYESTDKDFVWALHNKALMAAAAYLYNGVWDDDLKDIENFYLKSGGEFLVGTIDGSVVAMGALKKLEAEKGEVRRMRVDPDFWRRGFAQAILERLEVRAKELGFKSLELDTFITQEASHFLYKKNGYKEFKREMGKLSGVECVFYRKMI